jgi:hypothetical protein
LFSITPYSLFFTKPLPLPSPPRYTRSQVKNTGFKNVLEFAMNVMKKVIVLFAFCCMGCVEFSWGMKEEKVAGEDELFQAMDNITRTLPYVQNELN